MSDAPAGPPGHDPCRYPGCTRASRPDPATGRPSLYCEQPDPDGGPIHNRASAFRARRTQQAVAVAQDEQNLAAPVSLARATLEQRLTEVPAKIAELRGFFDDILTGIRAAGDMEAAGAEVEDAHREALTKVTEADRRAAAAERTARQSDERAAAAERERQEADLLAEEAMAETARVAEELHAEIAQTRAEADDAVALAREKLTTAAAEHRERLAERDAEVEQARQQANAAQVEAASAHAAQHAAERAAAADREALAVQRGEVERVRADATSEREALRAAHTEHLAQIQHSADERVEALQQALSLARESIEHYRAQLAETRTGAPARPRTTPRKRPQQ